MSYVIARPINGITINGREYILDDANRVRKFKNVKAARDFLRDNGIRKPEKEGIEILLDDDAAEELSAAPEAG